MGKLNTILQKVSEKNSPNSLSDLTQSTFQLARRGGRSLEKYYGYILAIFLAFLVADLSIIATRHYFLPTSVPPARFTPPPPLSSKLLADYEGISRRNLFSSDGVIPPALATAAKAKDGQVTDDLGPATLSDLPLTLIGTIVHINKGKSVATIEVKAGQNKILPYFPNDDIEGLATLLKVERKRAIFRNARNGRIEYIEIKDDSTLTFQSKGKAAGEIAQEGETNFSITRNDLNEYMKNLPELLQQATAVPNVSPTTGRIDGFKVIDIAPGSLFTKLGIQKDDLIKSVNGEPIDSPAKAMELYNKLRNERKIDLEIERRGRVLINNFSIN